MSLVKGNDTLLFSYDQGGNVISVNYNGTDYYYLRNGQNDIVKLIDDSGSTVVEYSYNSWGEQTGCVGTLSTALGILNPFRYRGYVYDEEMGLYYLQSRYYDPSLCRFISADVFLSTDRGVIGCNAFAYCGNEPVDRLDTSGSCPLWLEWLWIAHAAHKAVQNDLTADGTKDSERTIITEDGFSGCVDIMTPNRGIYEIKHSSGAAEYRAANQLKRYSGGQLLPKRSTYTGVQSGVVKTAKKKIPSKQIRLTYRSTEYTIKYQSAETDGVILYQVYNENGVEVTFKNYQQQLDIQKGSNKLLEIGTLVGFGLLLGAVAGSSAAPVFA